MTKRMERTCEHLEPQPRILLRSQAASAGAITTASNQFVELTVRYANSR